MELIGDCQATLINVIFSLKLQPFKRADKIHLDIQQLTCSEEKNEKENNFFFKECFLLLFF